MKLVRDPNTRNAFIAGAIGGMTAAVATQPVDTIKTRIQLVGKYYDNSIVKCFKHTVKTEGYLSLWKGLTGPLCSMIFINGFVFAAEDYSMKHIEKYTGNPDRYYVMNHMLAGGFAGGLQSLIAGPSELAKCRLQMEGLDAHTESKYKYGAPSLLREIYKTEGLRGTMRGMVPTVCREVPSFGAYFGTYFALADLGQHWFNFVEPDHMSKIFTRDFLWSLFSGGMAGCSCWAISYPFDVVKTKMQVDGITRTKYKNMRHCFGKVYAKYGLYGWYRGFTATMVRAFAVNSITFSVTLLAKNYFKDKFYLESVES